jgi:hypothetical protein
VAELARDDVERALFERQILDVPDVPLHVDSGDRTVLSRVVDELRRQVEAGDLRTLERARDRDDARSASDVEHPLTRLDTGVARQLGRGGRGEHLERDEVGPSLPLHVLDLVVGIHRLRFHRLPPTPVSWRFLAENCPRIQPPRPTARRR